MMYILYECCAIPNACFRACVCVCSCVRACVCVRAHVCVWGGVKGRGQVGGCESVYVHRYSRPHPLADP